MENQIQKIKQVTLNNRLNKLENMWNNLNGKMIKNSNSQSNGRKEENKAGTRTKSKKSSKDGASRQNKIPNKLSKDGISSKNKTINKKNILDGEASKITKPKKIKSMITNKIINKEDGKANTKSKRVKKVEIGEEDKNTNNNTTANFD